MHTYLLIVRFALRLRLCRSQKARKLVASSPSSSAPLPVRRLSWSVWRARSFSFLYTFLLSVLCVWLRSFSLGVALEPRESDLHTDQAVSHGAGLQQCVIGFHFATLRWRLRLHEHCQAAHRNSETAHCRRLSPSHPLDAHQREWPKAQRYYAHLVRRRKGCKFAR